MNLDYIWQSITFFFYILLRVGDNFLTVFIWFYAFCFLLQVFGIVESTVWSRGLFLKLSFKCRKYHFVCSVFWVQFIGLAIFKVQKSRWWRSLLLFLSGRSTRGMGILVLAQIYAPFVWRVLPSAAAGWISRGVRSIWSFALSFAAALLVTAPIIILGSLIASFPIFLTKRPYPLFNLQLSFRMQAVVLLICIIVPVYVLH